MSKVFFSVNFIHNYIYSKTNNEFFLIKLYLRTFCYAIEQMKKIIIDFKLKLMNYLCLRYSATIFFLYY